MLDHHALDARLDVVTHPRLRAHQLARGRHQRQRRHGILEEPPQPLATTAIWKAAQVPTGEREDIEQNKRRRDGHARAGRHAPL